MSFTQEEVELLKECLKEICDEHYFSSMHELKKKLVALTAKERELDLKATKCQDELNAVRANHFARPYTIEYRDATTQTERVRVHENDNKGTPAKDNPPTNETHIAKKSTIASNTDDSLNKTAQSAAYGDGDVTMHAEQQDEIIAPKLEPGLVQNCSEQSRADQDFEVICISDSD